MMTRKEFNSKMKSLAGIISNITNHSFGECISEAYSLGDMAYFDAPFKEVASFQTRRIDHLEVNNSFSSYYNYAFDAVKHKYNFVDVYKEIFYLNESASLEINAYTSSKTAKVIPLHCKNGLYESYVSENVVLVIGGVSLFITPELTPFSEVRKKIAELVVEVGAFGMLSEKPINKDTYNWFLDSLGQDVVPACTICFSK